MNPNSNKKVTMNGKTTTEWNMNGSQPSKKISFSNGFTRTKGLRTQTNSKKPLNLNLCPRFFLHFCKFLQNSYFAKNFQNENWVSNLQIILLNFHFQYRISIPQTIWHLALLKLKIAKIINFRRNFGTLLMPLGKCNGGNPIKYFHRKKAVCLSPLYS